MPIRWSCRILDICSGARRIDWSCRRLRSFVDQLLKLKVRKQWERLIPPELAVIDVVCFNRGSTLGKEL